MKDMLLSLADELEGMDCREGCRTCPADGTNDCRGDLSCEEAVARAAARRVREIVEHDECEVTTVSAYDLLPEEDREAITWVREMGGVEAAKARMMPEGCEWPRYEDGAPVWFGDEASRLGEVFNVSGIGLYLDGSYALNFRAYSKDERVKRPAPKVLDADGVEIRAGDEVYIASCGDGPWTVTKITTAHAWHVYGHSDELGSLDMQPNLLTHRAPVVAADGKPLEVGQTVWHVGNGVEFTVIGLPRSGEYQAVKIRLDDGAVTGLDPDQLTHEQPDTWERLEHDAEKTVCEYFGANYDCANCPLESARCAEEVKKDIIRRARKLAERDA